MSDSEENIFAETSQINSSDTLSSVLSSSNDESSTLEGSSEFSESESESQFTNSSESESEIKNDNDNSSQDIESVCKRNKVEEVKPTTSVAPFGTKTVFGSAAKNIVSFNSVSVNSDLPSKNLFAEEFCEKSVSEKVAIPTNYDILTGEEDESTVISVRGKLFEFNPESKDWMERGVGLFKLNKSDKNVKYRIIMRTDGVQKLILNSNLFSKMLCEIVQDKNIRFSAKNFDSKIQTFIMRMKSAEDAENLEKALVDAINKENC